MRFDDEEPDLDEREWDYWHEAELTPGLCERYGIEGHRGSNCPTVNNLTLKKPFGFSPGHG